MKQLAYLGSLAYEFRQDIKIATFIFLNQQRNCHIWKVYSNTYPSETSHIIQSISLLINVLISSVLSVSKRV